MGEIRIKFCCRCGTQTDMLTVYAQQTDAEKRSTDFNHSANTLELCNKCLCLTKSEFQAHRKFTTPAISSDQLLLFKGGT